MALEARMRASKVEQHGGRAWVPCGEFDEGATVPGVAFENYTYGVPKWLRDAEWIRQVDGMTSEQVSLNCVRTNDPDDPNADFFTASPAGGLTMTIDNPGAHGYIVPGQVYRVTIERIRGPRP